MKPVSLFCANRTIVSLASAVLVLSAGPLAAQVTAPGNGKALPDSAQNAPPFQGGGGGDFNALLKGEYIYSGGSANCVFAPFGGGFNSNLQPVDGFGNLVQGFTSSNSVNGVRVFNGDGTGYFKGRSVSIGAGGAGALTFEGKFTYVLGSDHSITIYSDGDSTGESLIGNPANIGKFALSNVPPLVGRVSEDLEHIVVLSSLSLTEAVEVSTQFDDNGNVIRISSRICYRDRSMTKLKR